MTALVIYHANCYDGFTAAWVARRAMPDCELFEGRYGEEPPYDLARERPVYILDFSYPRDQMLKLNEYTGMTGWLTVLDHHKTAEANCQGLDFCTFDMDRSGCRMEWDHFFPKNPLPDILLRIEDRDLWRFRYDSTPLVHAYVASQEMTLDSWNKLMCTTVGDTSRIGAHILRYIKTYIKKTVQEARIISLPDNRASGFDYCRVAVLNVPYQNASETADVMLSAFPDADFSLTYFQRADGKWQYSLRSRSDFDVSEVATQFGGGGHAGAAGFETDVLLAELIPDGSHGENPDDRPGQGS